MSEQPTLQLDDNVVLDADGSTSCRHCGTALGSRHDGLLARALTRERPPSAAGPHIRVPAATFVDRAMVLRHRLCPGCLVALATEIVPVGEPEWRGREIDP
jgi:N-methylhydantoinase B